MSEVGIEQRFWSKVNRSGVGQTVTDFVPTPCWDWIAGQSDGYGVFYDGTGRILAHRFSYELVYGRIPNGMDLHHRCLNKLCVNPDHLESLPILEHRKMLWLVCKNGHVLTPENTYVYHGKRRCKICHRQASSERYYRSKAAAQ